jgi:outer membrane lipoprotein-sorting protein
MKQSNFFTIRRDSLNLWRLKSVLTVFVTVLVILLGVYPDRSPADPSIRPQDIPETLAKKGKNVTALKCVMNVTSTYERGKHRQDIKGFLLYRRPNDFRFQGIAPAGNSLFELVIKANLFELYVPTDGKIIKGGKECFSRKFPDVAEIEGLIPMVLLQWKDVRFDRVLKSDADTIVIRLSFQGRVWGATLEPQKLLLTRLVRLSPDGDIDLTADFGDFQSGEDGWLPRRFEITSPSGGWKTLVKINKVEPNPFLVEKNFQLETTFSAKTEECR